MPRRSTRTVFCPAGRWTQVEWYVGTLFLTKSYSVGSGVRARWRYYSAGFPPYWDGSFTGSARITLPASFYTSLEFNPDRDTNVTVSV